MPIDRDTARKFSAEGAKSGATILGGQLIKENGQYIINKTNIMALLEDLLDQNVLLVIGLVENETKELIKTCLTCGDDYTGPECPRCARIRSRLRGK